VVKFVKTFALVLLLLPVLFVISNNPEILPPYHAG